MSKLLAALTIDLLDSFSIHSLRIEPAQYSPCLRSEFFNSAKPPLKSFWLSAAERQAAVHV